MSPTLGFSSILWWGLHARLWGSSTQACKPCGKMLFRHLQCFVFYSLSTVHLFPDSGNRGPEASTRPHMNVCFYSNSCIWYVASLPPLATPNDSETPLPEHDFSLQLRCPDTEFGRHCCFQTVSQGVLCVCVWGIVAAIIQLFILWPMSAWLAEIRKRACTTFSLLLRQCPWPLNSLQGPKEGLGSPCSVCVVCMFTSSLRSAAATKKMRLFVCHWTLFCV